jgi:hypothetical protein
MVVGSMENNLIEMLKKKKMFPEAAVTLIFELTQLIQ